MILTRSLDSAAVIHYKPERDNCSVIDPHEIYLCDSGAQYLDGTTDTTRTLHFGTPSEAEKEAYTLVLKGNIALDLAIFPKGTTGYALDALARQYLWVRLSECNSKSVERYCALLTLGTETRSGLQARHWPWCWLILERP
jgi:Xaa-Pro aminopeptidase